MHESQPKGAQKLIEGMLQTDPRKRFRVENLISDPYVLCEGVRMTAFEMASTIARQNRIKTFRRDVIKVAHNKAVEILVSLSVTLLFLQR